MAYGFIRFAIKYRHVILAAMFFLSVFGTVYYVRNLQDKVAVTQAELENNRIQQEALNKALSAKGRSNGKVKTMDHISLVSVHRDHGWLRVD